MDVCDINIDLYKVNAKLPPEKLNTTCNLCFTEENKDTFPLDETFFDNASLIDIWNSCTRSIFEDTKLLDPFERSSLGKDSANNIRYHIICKLCTQQLIETYLFLQKVNAASKYFTDYVSKKNLCDKRDTVDTNEKILDNTDNVVSIDVKTDEAVENIDSSFTDSTEVVNSDSSSGEIEEDNDRNGDLEAKEEIIIIKTEEDTEFEYKCKDCHESFDSKTGLIYHRKKARHNSHKCVCPICNKSYLYNYQLKNHMALHTEEKNQYKCKHCEKTFDAERYLLRHEKLHTGEKKFSCEICGKSFVFRGSLRIHHKGAHGDKKYVCTICNKGFSVLHNLRKHMRTHDKKRSKIMCKICNKHFVNNSTLKSHLLVHTGEKPFSCEFCGDMFRQLAHYLTHKRKHTGEKKWVCEHCNETFAEKRILETHVRKMHTKEPAVVCSDCGKEFYDARNFTRHKERMHGYVNPNKKVSDKRPKEIEKKCLCSVCGKSFANMNYLKKHSFSHAETKNFACDQCDKSFKFPLSLRSHKQVVHAGVKRYSCEFCGKLFTQNVHLRIHKESVHLKSNFDCKICGKKLGRKDALRIHMRNHAVL